MKSQPVSANEQNLPSWISSPITTMASGIVALAFAIFAGYATGQSATQATMAGFEARIVALEARVNAGTADRYRRTEAVEAHNGFRRDIERLEQNHGRLSDRFERNGQ